MKLDETTRTFETGATKNNDLERIDWIRMISLPALFAYGRYMSKHRRQADGNMREFDNWKGKAGTGGIPQAELVESLVRHTLDLAALQTGNLPMRECDQVETCCAILFNAMGYLHAYLSKGLKDSGGEDVKF